MKTAEEWTKDLWWSRGGELEVAMPYERIEQIQLDAMKEGMRRAADYAISDALMNHHDAEGRCICGNCSARRAILTAAEQLTEKDLLQPPIPTPS